MRYRQVPENPAPLVKMPSSSWGQTDALLLITWLLKTAAVIRATQPWKKCPPPSLLPFWQLIYI